MTSPDRSSLTLRVLVAAVALDGLVALVVAGLLGPFVGTTAALTCLAGSYASYAFPAPAAVAQRRALSIGALVVVAGYAAWMTLGQHTPTVDGVAQVGPLLSGLLVGVQVAQSLVQTGRRELLVATVVGLFMTVLAAGLAPGPAVAVPVLLAWPASIVVVALAHRLGAADGVGAVAVLRRSGPGSTAVGHPAGRLATVVSVCVLAGLALFLVLPRPEGFSARNRLLGGDTPGQPTSSAGEPRSASYYTSGYLDLRARGGLGDDPVLEVPADSPQLWRSSVLDLYDGSGWQSSQTGGRSLGSGPDYVVPANPDDVPADGAATRTDVVVLRSGWNGVVVGPGPVTAVHAESGHLVQVRSGLALFDVSGGMPSYAVTTAPEVLDPGTLRAASGPDAVGRIWTELPTSLPLRVRQLAATITAGATTRYDAVDAVDRYLRSNETYRLDSPVPGPGEDPVDDFLFDSHQGFCEQFASAAVVLLRARGIPARLVSGFGYGHPAPSGRRVMLASDAHAWVEVYYPGIGWSASDPTAGAALAPAPEQSALSRALSAVQAFAAGPGGRLLLAVGLLLVALVGVGVVWGLRWLARRRARREAGRQRVGPVLAAFLRLQESRDRTGSRSPPAETLAELAFRLPPDSRTAVTVLERECYAAQPPSEAEVQAAIATFDRLRGELEAAGRR